MLFISTGGLALPAQDSLQKEQQNIEPSVTLITIDGTIGPTTFSYIKRGHQTAKERDDVALIIKMDTPGGLLTTTQDIVQLMLASDLPIAVYVSPEGGAAGSAGTFITLAAHVAAMAPTTTIGAASPVQSGGAQMDSVMKKKIFNYSENFIESIAEKRGRNAEWAVSAVRDGEALTETEALELNVIDLIAEDLDDLLTQMDGKVVEGDTLQTSNASVYELEQTLAERFFSILLRPEIILILTLISIYGIVGEVTNPGAIVPGVAGAIALILLLYGVSALPLNTAGFILIGLAIVLFAAEAFTPTFGILLTGGSVAFFLGALMLFQDLPKEMQLSWYWLVPATILTALFFGWIATAGIKAQYSENKTGKEALIGKKAEVTDDINQTSGKIFISGEYWNAISNQKINAGQYCEIVQIDGLTATVKPLTEHKE